MIHYIESHKDSWGRHFVLWQLGDYHYEIEVLEFSSATPSEDQIYSTVFHTSYTQVKEIYDEAVKHSVSTEWLAQRAAGLAVS